MRSFFTMRQFATLLLVAGLLVLARWLVLCWRADETDADAHGLAARTVVSSEPITMTSEPSSSPVVVAPAQEPKPLGAVPMASGRQPGSEGWGPHILHALEQGTPQQAYDASTQLFVCEKAADLLAQISNKRAVTTDPRQSSGLTALMASYMDDQRACQTVTPEIFAMKPLLVRKAALGGVFGAADKCWLLSGCADIEAAQRETLFAALQADARKGDEGSLFTLAIGLGKSAMPDDQRQVFVLAYRTLQAREAHLPPLVPWLKAMGPLAVEIYDIMSERTRFSQPPTEEMRQQADAIVNAYYERRKAAKRS